MKNGILAFVAGLVAAVIIVYFFRPGSDDNAEWKEKIDNHQSVLETLKASVDKMDKQLKEKDSILLAYMQTLNKSLYELDKEAGKDKATINQNEQKQAEMLKAFCDNIDGANKPEFCR